MTRAGTSPFSSAAPTSILVALALATAPVRADVTKSQCVDANSNAQALRLDGKLAAARHELQVCGDPSCPTIVRTDCTQRMDDLERAQPTILFDVKDASGADAIAVKVTLDGHPLTDKLQGSALPFDPGEHVFTFTLVGHDPVTRRFLVKEGEKDRRERIVMGATPEASAPPATPAAPPPSPTPTPPPAMTGLGAQRIVGLTTGGFGVAGLAVGSIFGLLTFSAANAQKSDCTSAGDCASHAQALSDHASGEADAAVSTVAFIVGGVLLVTGGTLFFTAHTGPSVEGSARALTLAPIVGRDTGGMSLWGEF